jgi:hypothetical protein
VPPESALLSKKLPSTRNVTLPPAAAGVTVALRVMTCPTHDGLGVTVSDVVDVVFRIV